MELEDEIDDDLEDEQPEEKAFLLVRRRMAESFPLEGKPVSVIIELYNAGTRCGHRLCAPACPNCVQQEALACSETHPSCSAARRRAGDGERWLRRGGGCGEGPSEWGPARAAAYPQGAHCPAALRPPLRSPATHVVANDTEMPDMLWETEGEVTASWDSIPAGATVTYSYSITPKQTGPFHLPPLMVKYRPVPGSEAEQVRWGSGKGRVKGAGGVQGRVGSKGRAGFKEG